MKRLLVVALFVGVVQGVNTQSNPNVGPNDSFGWDQQGTSLTVVQAYIYKYYLDGAVTGSVWQMVTCTGTTSPFACQAKTPAFSQGQHQITLTAANSTGESAQSSPFVFVFGNPPSNPNNIRVIKGTP